MRDLDKARPILENLQDFSRLRERIEELEKRLEELEKRIGGQR
jgi:tetrahydromethanopterin S-methyltransferase subunit G